MENTWKQVDEYLEKKTQRGDINLQHVLENNRAQGLPSIDVSPNLAKFLHTLAKIKGAKRILEIGTLGGYSTIWLAKAVLPVAGTVTTLEIDPHHAEVAKQNLQSTGLSELVEIKVGSAHHSLKEMIALHSEPFDFIFIDADKESSVAYFQAALQLSKSGTVIVTDNVVRKGEVVNENSDDKSVRGVRDLFDYMENLENVSSSALQTVGSKGYDGLCVSVVE